MDPPCNFATSVKYGPSDFACFVVVKRNELANKKKTKEQVRTT